MNKRWSGIFLVAFLSVASAGCGTSEGTNNTSSTNNTTNTTTPTCDDGVRNGDETGVDCGGGTCAACALGGGCAAATDCAAGTCANNVCACEAGYTESSGACVDVDECADGTDTCADEATCTNTEGGFTCACNAGYTGDGMTCADADECTDSTDTCDDAATCTNTPGGFTCACNAGYTGDGATCADVDECTDNTDTCADTNATCTNTPGSFTCACDVGYAGDGVTCTDVNECDDDTDTCADEATCTNTEGGFTCACNAGYIGDGTTCRLAAHVYWITTTGSIWRKALGGPDQAAVELASGISSLFAIATDPTTGDVFYNQGGNIVRADRDAANPTTIITGTGSIGGMTVDRVNRKLYWSDFSGRAIKRADLNGANAETLATNIDSPSGIHLDVAGGKLYVIQYNNTALLRANLDGTGVETIVPNVGGQGIGVAVDPVRNKVYYSTRGATIYIADLDGSNATTFIGGQAMIQGIVLDRAGSRLYWSDAATSEISSATLGEGGDVRALSPSGGNGWHMAITPAAAAAAP